MKTGHRQYRSASLEIKLPSGQLSHLRENLREVFDLKAETPRVGHGSELMRRVCGEADRTHTVLMLTVDQESLFDWYGRFGFRRCAESRVMARAPKAIGRPMKVLEAAHG